MGKFNSSPDIHCLPILLPEYQDVVLSKSLAGCHIITLLLATCGNVLVAAAIIRNQRLKTVTNYFILSLSIADAIVGVIGQPLLVYLLWHSKSRSCILEKIQYFFGSVSCGASGLLLCLVSVERYLSICKPFVYNQILNEKRVFIIIINVWLSSIALTSLSYSNMDKVIYQSILLGSFILVLLVIIPCYVLIYRTAVKQLIRIETELSKSVAEQGRKQRKAAITILYVVIGFLFCWAPYFVTGFIWAIYEKKGWKSNLVINMFWMGLTLGYANSCINPMLYTFNNREIKHGILKQIIDIFGDRVIELCCPYVATSYENIDRELSYRTGFVQAKKSIKNSVTPLKNEEPEVSTESRTTKLTNSSSP